MRQWINLTKATCMAIAVVMIANSADAQRDAGAKARGDYNFYGSSGGRSMNHARDYSRGFQTYARQTPSMTPQIARDEAAGIGHNIDQAKKHFANMRKATTDKETLTSLEQIDQQLAAAAKAHAEMHEMCQKEMIDGEACMKCCHDVDAALSKALAEHEKLMKRLTGHTPTPAVKK